MTGDLSLSTLIDLVKREAPTISRPRMQEIAKRLVITSNETDRYGGFQQRSLCTKPCLQRRRSSDFFDVPEKRTAIFDT